MARPRTATPRIAARGTLGWIVATAALVVATALSVGCVATVEERPPRVVYVSGPPPPPLGEPEMAPAAPGMVWVGGYWHWSGVKYLWIPGHWESAPMGYVWVPSHYAYLGGRHAYHPGHWWRGRVRP